MAGNQILTADGVVGISGKPVRVYSLNVVSGATAGVVKLYHGTAASGDYSEVVGTANQGQSFDFGACGKYFPSGCYADLGANITSVDFDMKVISRT